ncbi:HAMP domain-containing histidine kinase [Streptomyces sp. NBC_01537]
MKLRPRPRPWLRVRLHGRSLRVRLLVLISTTLIVVCCAMALTTVLAERLFLMQGLDTRVHNAASRSQGGMGLNDETAADTNLNFLNERGQAVGTLAARYHSDGTISAAGAVTADGGLMTLSAEQIAVLADVPADGAVHTRSIPALGTYRVTRLADGGLPVLAGLPADGEFELIDKLIAAEAVVALLGLVAAGCACAVVIRRQLRPLGRVAATAVEVSRSPLGHGEVGGLTRVPQPDTDPGTEAGQVGAALNRMIDHVESSMAVRQQSEARMRRFLADASHELRTPLASIAGYAELANRGGRGGPATAIDLTRAWQRVASEASRMTGLVEDLLLLARLDEGRPLRSAEVDLTSLVAEAVWDARAAAGDGDARHWQVRLPDGPVLVMGDEERIHQVVANLLANARTHTPPGTAVVAEVAAAGGDCVVRVADDGPGIPAALLPAVFERFSRGDASRSRGAGGTGGGSGLGLAIVAAIVEAHGGSIAVDSVPGRTVFTVRMPNAARPAFEDTPVGRSGVWGRSPQRVRAEPGN